MTNVTNAGTQAGSAEFQTEVSSSNPTETSVKFDDLGNYVPPDDRDKKNGGSKSGWVN